MGRGFFFLMSLLPTFSEELDVPSVTSLFGLGLCEETGRNTQAGWGGGSNAIEMQQLAGALITVLCEETNLKLQCCHRH